jgi:tetratricopeptide (TPR) repeat protein
MSDSFPRDAAVGGVLVAVTLAVFWLGCANGYVNFDDGVYVQDNPYLQGGLTVESLRWAFTTFHAGNWHPLTWVSYLIDYELGRPEPLKPFNYHLTNVLLHVANVLLLFIVLRRMTGAVWRSALVAILFGVHPLHVESVAWIAERKDVLSTFFAFLTLWAYAWFAAGPRWSRYGLVVAAYVLGLLAKPMVVTLPCVLLLLDYWPLERLRPITPRAAWRCIREKIPLFLLAAGSCLVTWEAQQQERAIQSLEVFSLWTRLQNALVSYTAYMGQMFWPRNLAVFYPHPGANRPAWQAAAAALLLLALLALALKLARRRPYLVVGWLWYLGTLVPVIGLVQVGSQALADRYTYLPLVGLFIAFSWGIADIALLLHCRVSLIAFLEAGLVTACALLSWVQVGYWKNSSTLWNHALAVTQNNWLAHLNLGVALEHQGNRALAAEQYEAALRIEPEYATAHNNLGVYLIDQGREQEGFEHLYEALRIAPDYTSAHKNLARALAQRGQTAQALEHFLFVLRARPDDGGTHYNVGLILYQQGDLDAAADHLETAAKLLPYSKDVCNNLGVVLAHLGKASDAEKYFHLVLRFDPNYADAYYNLGHLYFQQGKLDEALDCYHRAVTLRRNAAGYHASLALALSDRGQSELAAAEYQEALRLDPQWPEITYRTAWNQATHPKAGLRNGPMALQLARQLCAATGNSQARYLDTLAAAYAELGRFDDALKAAHQALGLASAAKDNVLAKEIQNRLAEYERRQPHRSSESTPDGR